jgi:hypothetical protein
MPMMHVHERPILSSYFHLRRTVIRLIRIGCAIPVFYPYKMPAVLCTGDYLASRLDERLPVLSILSWYVMRVNIRTFPPKARLSNCEHLPVRGGEH